MAGMAEKALATLGIEMPSPAKPIANYVACVRSGNLLVISGQLCFGGEGKLVAKGQLGGTVSVEDGQKAARACAVNLLAQVKAALGELDQRRGRARPDHALAGEDDRPLRPRDQLGRAVEVLSLLPI